MADVHIPEAEQTTRQEIGYDLDPTQLAPLPDQSVTQLSLPRLVEEAEPLHLKDWQLDEKTRAIGRIGIAQNKAILRNRTPKWW